jgi:hypothetical protein
MADKHEMTDAQVASYERIHNYDDPLSVEQGKVRREKATAADYRRRGQQRVKHRLRQITRPEDVDDWDDDPLLDDVEQRAERELRNARTHKQRLHGLSEHID